MPGLPGLRMRGEAGAPCSICDTSQADGWRYPYFFSPGHGSTAAVLRRARPILLAHFSYPILLPFYHRSSTIEFTVDICQSKKTDQPSSERNNGQSSQQNLEPDIYTGDRYPRSKRSGFSSSKQAIACRSRSSALALSGHHIGQSSVNRT